MKSININQKYRIRTPTKESYKIYEEYKKKVRL